MKTFKILFFIIIATISAIGSASTWKHKEFRRGPLFVRLSYTLESVPATYGSNGGRIAGLFFADVHSSSSLLVSGGEIVGVRALTFREDNANHSFAQLENARTYAENLWAGKTYRLKVIVDGRFEEFDFKID